MEMHTEKSAGVDMTRARSDQLYQTLSEIGIMVVTDPKGVITEANAPFCDLTGYTPEEIIGRNIRLLNSNSYPDSFFSTLWKQIVKGSVWRGTLCNQDKFGTLFWVDMSITPIKDAVGRVVEYIAMFNDITSLIKMRNELEIERSLVTAATKASNISIFQEDIDTGLSFFLDEHQSKGKMFDKHDWVANRVPLSGLSEISKANDNPGLSVKLPLYSMDGDVIEWHTYQVVREFDDPDEGPQRVVMLRNIDETETALASAKENLVAVTRSNEKRNQIYGMIAHELRTPVSAIQMICEHHTDDLAHFRQEISEATGDLMNTLDDMRLLVNPDLKRPIRINEGLLSEINRQVTNMVASSIASTNIHFQSFNALPIAASAIYVKSDLYRIKVAVSNLVKNAAFHSGGKNVWMSNGFRYTEKGETELVWLVGDDGQGLSHEAFERLVKPYERGSTSADGTGFGLHITKSWIEEMGGTLSFRPLKRGSEFIVSIPYDPDRTTEFELDAQEPAEVLEPSEFTIPEGFRVLMVEDDRMLRTLGKALLEKLGASVELAEDGRIGLKKIPEGYDLVLSDYFMPNMTGVGMITEARAKGIMTPIIGVTAATIGDQEGELLDAGACAVIHKPLTAKALQETLNKLKAKGAL